jgi:hypothetical protein
MKGDFTRFGFNSSKHYSRVLHQQGRVALDADSNEASAILLHHLRMLTRDLFGAGGGPPDSGFSLDLDKTANPAVLSLGPGHYYVDGILCENERWTPYAEQPDFTPAPPVNDEGGDALLEWLAQPSSNQAFWVYLDLWERHVSWIEDDSIREPALGGPDTCSRAKVVWQVKALPWDEDGWGNPRENQEACTTPLSSLTGLGTGRMTARVDPGAAFTDPCIVAPDAAYRGAENHLYRLRCTVPAPQVPRTARPSSGREKTAASPPAGWAWTAAAMHRRSALPAPAASRPATGSSCRTMRWTWPTSRVSWCASRWSTATSCWSTRPACRAAR